LFALTLTFALTLLRLILVRGLQGFLGLGLRLGLGLSLGLRLSGRTEAALSGCTGSGPGCTGACTSGAAPTASATSPASAATSPTSATTAASSGEGDAGDYCQGYGWHQRYDSLPVHYLHLTFPGPTRRTKVRVGISFSLRYGAMWRV
jgi:hypothetical protein